jgi:hypothetical protein
MAGGSQLELFSPGRAVGGTSRSRGSLSRARVPSVRSRAAMRRARHPGDLRDEASARYVFLGQHVVLESTPWDDVPGVGVAVDENMPSDREVVQSAAVPSPFPPRAPSDDVAGLDVAVDDRVPAGGEVVQPSRPLPCWQWCGRSSCATGCHPASRFGRAPLIPCLSCGRVFFSCQAAPGSVLTCSVPCRDMWSVLLAGDAARVQAFAEEHLEGDVLERWQERAAIMETERERNAAGRALAAVWRGRHEEARA